MRTKPVQRESLPARIRYAIGDFASRAVPPASPSSSSAASSAVFTVLFSLPIATSSGEQAPFVDASLHRRVGDLRHRTLDRRHGHVLVADRPRLRLRRRRDRRHRRADPGVDPRAHHQPSSRAAAEAAGGRRREPLAHPQGSHRREPGDPARRDRQPARHGRDQRAGHRGDRGRTALPAHAHRGRRPVGRHLAVDLHIGDGVHQHRFPTRPARGSPRTRTTSGSCL